MFVGKSWGEIGQSAAVVLFCLLRNLKRAGITGTVSLWSSMGQVGEAGGT